MADTAFEKSGGWPGVLGVLTSHRDLAGEVAEAAMSEILAGNATPAQIAAFMVALRMKGETVDELGGLVDAMLVAAATVPLEDPDTTMDVVGTGGDRAHTINVSTIAAFVVAGAGAKVCKHGNRAASSSCGTADVLEALGVAIDLDAHGVARCVGEAGMGFCFAPRFHPAFRHAGPPRRELGIATSFNVLGPMTNPGRVRRHLIGLADVTMAERMLGVLAARGSRRAMVVHGDDGLDEVTTTTTTTITELADGAITTWTLDPSDFGIAPAAPDDLRGADATVNAAAARAVLAGEPGHHRDIVAINAAVALVVAGLADSVAEGHALAGRVLDDGRAGDVLDRLVTVSNDAARAG
jgi:anthranilate phosphoribosyltransferase